MNATELEGLLRGALDRAGVVADPLVVPTEWNVGPVAAYLFPHDPVTLIDAGVEGAATRELVADRLARRGLGASDVRRVIVTHAHSDHYGGAAWLQVESGCEVLLHAADIATTEGDRAASVRRLFGPLGFSPSELERWTVRRSDRARPRFDALREGTYGTGASRLRVERRPGHTPGHVWITDETTGVMFVGDYLLASAPTNAGLAIDPDHPSGRAPLLRSYHEGLRELARRQAPVLFASHGPPISDHAALAARRLAKSEHRTGRVLRALRERGPCPALELGRVLYRDRTRTDWGALADLVGRLDLLVEAGHARGRIGEDGVWLFEPIDEEDRDA